MNVINYITITCNLKKNVRLQITFDYMKNVIDYNRLRLQITITPCLMCCLSFFNLRLLITPLVSSNFSCSYLVGLLVMTCRWACCAAILIWPNLYELWDYFRHILCNIVRSSLLLWNCMTEFVLIIYNLTQTGFKGYSCLSLLPSIFSAKSWLPDLMGEESQHSYYNTPDHW